VVPIRNEARCIESTLRSLLTQDFPQDQFEVIVADGLSTDGTIPIVRRLQQEFPNLKLVYNPRRFSSAARNTAVRHMRGEYVVIIDGHCHIPDQYYLKNLVKAFEESRADCLGRPQPLQTMNPTPFQSAVSVARQSRLGHNPDSDIFSNESKFVPPQNTAVAYRRQVFSRIGLFDPKFDACEDVEFNQRVYEAGMTCYFTPALKIMYHPRGSLRALFTQLGRYGCGRARLAAKNFRSLTLPAVVPPLALVWLAVAPLLGFLVPGVHALLAVSVLAYCLVVFLATCWLGRHQPWSVIQRIPAVFAAIHFGFAWGFLQELFRKLENRRRGAAPALPLAATASTAGMRKVPWEGYTPAANLVGKS
jgi:GT2 family glycosyltransferase